MGPKKSTWIVGAAFLAAAILAGGWFVAISPTLDTAQATHAEAESVAGHNDMLRLQLSTLKKQYENLDEYKADLAGLAVQIPSEAAISDYLRDVAALAESSGAAIVGVTSGTPLDVVPMAAEVAAVTPPVATDGSAAQVPATEAPATESTSPPVTAVPAQTGVEPIPGFVAVPIDVVALGTVPDVVAFLDALQSGPQRLFLVTALDGRGQDEAEASGGRPATARGDLELRITGYVYVLEDTSAAATPDGADASPTPSLPVPDGSKVPFSGA